MQALDWILVALPLLMVLGIGIYTQRYMKSVADFLSGGRVAGRYILAVASGEMQAGAVVFVAAFEQIGKSGFTLAAWWYWISIPISILVGISGFVVYRFRETRAMTLSQFFEIRYSKRFRLFTGIVGFLAGICNFGIIPAVGSRFLVYFLGFPANTTLFSVTLPTYLLLMAVLLSCTVLLVLSGGIVTVMVTNCVEGIMSQLFYLVIICALLLVFKWSQISEVMLNRPPGHSFVNPFDAGQIADFNIWTTLMGIFLGVYGTQAWQNASAYKSAALNAHESRMGVLLKSCREMGKQGVVILLAVCALTFLEHPGFAAASATSHQIIGQIANPQIQQQMTIPIAVSYMLPMGIKGLLCAVLLMGVFGGDGTHLHSWGSIFIQDVLLPIRKKPFTPQQHIKILRWSIVGVAFFAFLFGSLFRQTEYIYMWWTVTTALFVGGAGSAIIGGLYWKKGTTEAAWAAMIVGSILSAGGILARVAFGSAFPYNGVVIGFWATVIAIVVYVVVSLLTCREDFNLERMLHRGKYQQIILAVGEAPAPVVRSKWQWSRLIGFDENFTLGDKWIAGGLFGWGVFWFGVVVVGSIWNFFAPWSNAAWSAYWHVTAIGIPVLLAFVTGIWFTWGGVRDMRALFRHLRAQKINDLDDGTVVGHQNLDEATLPGVTPPVGAGSNPK